MGDDDAAQVIVAPVGCGDDLGGARRTSVQILEGDRLRGRR